MGEGKGWVRGSRVVGGVGGLGVFEGVFMASYRDWIGYLEVLE